MVSQGTVSAVVVGIIVVIVGSLLTAGGRAERLSETVARAPQEALPPPMTEQQEPTSTVSRIRETNRALQNTLSTEADTDVSEAFSSDLEQPGGLISSVSRGETGGGNPDFGNVGSAFSAGSSDPGFTSAERQVQRDLGISVGEIRV